MGWIEHCGPKEGRTYWQLWCVALSGSGITGNCCLWRWGTMRTVVWILWDIKGAEILKPCKMFPAGHGKKESQRSSNPTFSSIYCDSEVGSNLPRLVYKPREDPGFLPKFRALSTPRPVCRTRGIQRLVGKAANGNYPPHHHHRGLACCLFPWALSLSMNIHHPLNPQVVSAKAQHLGRS